MITTDLPALRIRDRALLPIVQGGMGVGVSAHRLAGSVAREGAVGTISSIDLRRHHSDLMKLTGRSRDRALIERVNLVALEREVDAALKLADGRGLVAVNVSISRESFRVAHDVSSYSLVALTKAGFPMMEGRSAAVLTLSYLGAVRAVPNYNVMGLAKASLEAGVRYLATALGPNGIRVNGISAGPIRTLAAAGIGDFPKLLACVARNSPLRRNVTIDEVGNVAAFLCSDLASGITGEITYVDCGYSTVAVGDP